MDAARDAINSIPRLDIDTTNKLCRHRPETKKGRLIQPTLFIGYSVSGDEGVRTPDLSVANAALSQLSYIPIFSTQSMIAPGYLYIFLGLNVNALSK
jgi:hypothetical protein